MADLNRLTKAQIIELLEKTESEKAELEEKLEKNKKQIEMDMAFGMTEKESDEHTKAQRKKDFIKRMTRGRWTSQDKYEEFQEENRNKVRI